MQISGNDYFIILFSVIYFINYGCLAKSLSLKKCEKYADILKVQEIFFNETEGETSIFASPKELPFTALIGYGKGILAYWLCGGTLVSPRYVLSAAHCAEDERIGRARMAWLGDLWIDTMEDEASTNIVDIEERIVHPMYKAGSRNHDLAIFRLQFDMNLTPYIRPACIYQTTLTGTTISPGWGANGDAFLKSYKLIKGEGFLTSDESCKKEFYNLQLLHGFTMDGHCAVASPPSRNMCQSDTGGGLLFPLQVNGYKMWSLIGVNTLIKDCGSNRVFYTSLKPYISWIESTIWPDDDSP